MLMVSASLSLRCMTAQMELSCLRRSFRPPLVLFPESTQVRRIRNSSLIANPWVILHDVLKANAGGKSMFHLIWYVLIGLISGVIAKSVMHVHMTIFWTIMLGIIGSIIGGCVTHMFSRPANDRNHPAGLIFSDRKSTRLNSTPFGI